MHDQPLGQSGAERLFEGVWEAQPLRLAFGLDGTAPGPSPSHPVQQWYPQVNDAFLAASRACFWRCKILKRITGLFTVDFAPWRDGGARM